MWPTGPATCQAAHWTQPEAVSSGYIVHSGKEPYVHVDITLPSRQITPLQHALPQGPAPPSACSTQTPNAQLTAMECPAVLQELPAGWACHAQKSHAPIRAPVHHMIHCCKLHHITYFKLIESNNGTYYEPPRDSCRYTPASVTYALSTACPAQLMPSRVRRSQLKLAQP